MTDHYDTIVVGAGFAGAFFLMRYLERASSTDRVLVLERGNRDRKTSQLTKHRTSSLSPEEFFVNNIPKKQWLTSPGFDGNSECW